MSEDLKFELTILALNAVIIICFTFLAIAFDTWWIVLFSGLFWTYSKKKG